MRIIAGVNYYSPREVAKMGLITNSRGKNDYGYVLRLVKSGKLNHKIVNEDSSIVYYMISEQDIHDYLAQFKQENQHGSN